MADNEHDVVDEIEPDDTGDDADEDGDDEEKDDKKEFVPPTKEEWERTQAALTRANGEAKKHRLKAKELAKGAGEGQKNEQAVQDAEAKYKPVAIRSAAKAAFLEAGATELSGDQLKKLLRLVDMDDVEVDDDGDVIGLDDQVDSIKADFPALFGGGKQEKQQRKRAPHIGAAGRTSGGGGTRPKSTGELIAARVLNQK